MTAPLKVWRGQLLEGPGWMWLCHLCPDGDWALAHPDALAEALGHLCGHAPVLRDATGVVALFGPAAAWCPLCDQRIANGLAEDEARHVAAEHWQWHLGENA